MNPPADRFAEQLAHLTTESRDPILAAMDMLSLEERCALQNRLDQGIAKTVASELLRIADAVRKITRSLQTGGRLIYVGAGTSGRLGVLDAAECPPTFGTEPSLVQAIIAGGLVALTQPVEGAEDDREAGRAAIDEKTVSAADTVVGITASGRTPFVLAALEHARELGAATIGVTNNRPSELEAVSDPTIAVVVGPEFIAGSTRLKSGTAQKLVLNMLTTQTMVELGKTYGNAMVDVMATNAKLIVRARRIVCDLTGADESAASLALDQACGSAKLATLMLIKGIDASAGRELLRGHAGRLRKALE